MEEVFALMYAFHETFETAMSIPIPYRRWLIERYNRQKSAEHKAENPDAHSDTSQPLSPAEKARYMAPSQSKPPQSQDLPPSQFLNSQRNKG